MGYVHGDTAQIFSSLFCSPFSFAYVRFFYQINKVALSLVSVAGHFFGKNEKYD